MLAFELLDLLRWLDVDPLSEGTECVSGPSSGAAIAA
jgi:hypothetical protein